MFLIIVILLVAYIIVPLLGLTLKENVQRYALCTVYVITLLYVLWVLFVAHGPL